jgi:hypothetical protein
MFLAYELYAGYLDTHQTAGRADDTPFFWPPSKATF